MIFPAFYSMAKRSELKVPVIGVGSTKLSTAQLRKHVKDSIKQAGKIDIRAALEHILSLLQYVNGNYSDSASFIALKQKLGSICRPEHYLSIPLSLFATVTKGLTTAGLTALVRYIKELSVTGLTSNPSPFDHAIQHGDFYDDSIRQKSKNGKSAESLFFELAVEVLEQAVDLFRPVHVKTGGVYGWASPDVSPLLAGYTATTIMSSLQLHTSANRPNLFIKIPGTPAGIPAIEEAICAGVPLNVTLLFSAEHYLEAIGSMNWINK